VYTETCAYSWCRKKFTAQRSTARYCSSDCRVAAFHQREREREEVRILHERHLRGDRPCGNLDCDNVVEWVERPDRLYCSNACKQHWYREMNRPLSDESYASIVALLVETNAKTDPGT